jgi:hypothetical protein
MVKINHQDETCVEMTGTDDRVLFDGSIVRMGHWVAPSKEVADIAHTWFEDLETTPEFLHLGHNRRFVKRIVTYVYPSVSWAGQFQESKRIVRLNVAKLSIDNVVCVCVHEIAHAWKHARQDTTEYKEFEEAILADLGSIDYYSRGRKLQNMMKKNPSGFVNEIHSIISALKYGNETGDASLQNLEADERRTPEEIKRFKKYAVDFDKLHPDKATNKRYTHAIK